MIPFVDNKWMAEHVHKYIHENMIIKTLTVVISVCWGFISFHIPLCIWIFTISKVYIQPKNGYFKTHVANCHGSKESETSSAWQAMTVGSQEDTASCNIQTNLVSVVTEAQSVGKEKLIDLSDLTGNFWKNTVKGEGTSIGSWRFGNNSTGKDGDEEKSRIREQSEQITQGH